MEWKTWERCGIRSVETVFGPEEDESRHAGDESEGEESEEDETVGQRRRGGGGYSVFDRRWGRSADEQVWFCREHGAQERLSVANRPPPRGVDGVGKCRRKWKIGCRRVSQEQSRNGNGQRCTAISV